MSDRRKVALYLGLVFGAGWALVGLIAWVGGLENKVAFAWLATLLRFVPLVVVLVIRLGITREGWGDSGLRVGPPRLYMLAYVLPVIAIAVVYGAVSLAGFGRLTLDVGELISKGPPPQGSITILIVSAFLLDPMVLALTAFGEELGWRGYLLPKLLGLGLAPALLLQGLLWGLWQAPLILITAQTPAQAVYGVIGIILFSVTAGSVWGILVIASGSVYISTIAAAMRESIVGLFGYLFVATAANYREASGIAEIVLWGLLVAVFLTPLPIFRAAPRSS